MVTSLPIRTQRHTLFRGALLLLALVLAGQATWLLTAEFTRPPIVSFPADAQAAEALGAQRNAANLAASFGFIRGDLWADSALTYLGLFWNDTEQEPTADSKSTKLALKAADQALSLAPHDARIWLVLASIDLQLNWINEKAAAAALRMSYYTDANNPALIPLRLRLALRSDALTDEDFQRLIKHDVQLIVTRKPELKGVILSAYAGASQLGQKFLAEALKDLDPGLVARLGTKG
jgi:hypothetical protein